MFLYIFLFCAFLTSCCKG